MPPIKQYSIVKILALHRDFSAVDIDIEAGERLPAVGDEATVVEVYKTPVVGYELECSESDGTNNWLMTFSLSDATYEVIWEPSTLKK